MHTQNINDPLPLRTRLTFLAHLTSILCCTHLRSRASYRSSSPITCEFIHRSRLWVPNSIYMVRARALELNGEKKRKRRAQYFFFSYHDPLPAWRSLSREDSMPKCPFNLLESCLKTLVARETFLLFVLILLEIVQERKHLKKFYICILC